MFVEKAISDRSKDYMNARRVAKEFEVITRGLNRNAPATPPTSSAEEVRQVDLWKRYISWEKGNPLKSEDSTLVIKRGTTTQNTKNNLPPIPPNFLITPCLLSGFRLRAVPPLSGPPSRHLVRVRVLPGGEQQADGGEGRHEPPQGAARGRRLALREGHLHAAQGERPPPLLLC